MSNTPDITTLALLNLVRLLAAELVAGKHRDDVTKLIGAMDRQLDNTPLPRGVDVVDARDGVRRARDLLRPYVAHVRDQAEVARIRDRAKEGMQIVSEREPAARGLKYLQ